MTDKQIIIDGVDVGECEFYSRCTDQCLDYKRWYNKPLCKHLQNCHYKQLKRKEQENEELRQYHNKCCKEFENEKQELLEKYNQVSRDFHNGKYCDKENCSLLQAKEQECERLKWYLNAIRSQELFELDVDWSEYETQCCSTDYSNIINLVEEALKEKSSEECRYEY